MDLSSLEGPPIRDTRFTNTSISTSCADNIPHIRLQHIQSPVSPISPLEPSRDLPPRPRSTSGIPPRNKYSSRRPTDFWPSCQPTTTTTTNNTTSGIRRSNKRPSRGSSQPAPAVSSPSPRHHHPQSQNPSTPHQLVWVESEQIWILTTEITTSQTPPSLSPMFSTGSPAGRTATLSHSRSMESYPSMCQTGDVEPDDLPPPYERHIYDRPVGHILPAATRVRPENVPNPADSRWSAVGRRINQTPPI